LKDGGIVDLADDIVNRYFNRLYISQHIDDFTITEQFKKDKNNIKIQTFVAIMKAEGHVIDNLQRFDYVFIKRPKYDVTGQKVKTGKGAQMMLRQMFEDDQEGKYELDEDAYLSGAIMGMIVSFIRLESTDKS
jgi:hypothetical protein